jgi:hypothetical protein
MASEALETALSTLSATYALYIHPLLPPPLASTITTTTTFVSTLLLPILRSGDLPSLAALLVILYISIRTLDYVRRTILGWVMFFVKLGLVLGMVQVGWYVNQYGWEKAARDAGWIGGVVWGWVEGAWEGSAGHGGNGRGGWGGGNASGRQWGGAGNGGRGGRWT